MWRFFALIAVGILLLAATPSIDFAMAQKESPAHSLDEWKYPGATQRRAGAGAGAHYAILTTKDGLDKVLAFYGKKVGAKLTSDGPAGGTAVSGNDNGDVAVFQDDSVQPDGKMRPVAVHIFVQRTKTRDLTLVVSRAQGEDHTHISLTYRPK